MPSLDVDMCEKCLYHPPRISSAAHCKYFVNACHQSEETQLLSTLLQKYRHIYCANSFKKCQKKKPYKTITCCLQGNLDNQSAYVDNNGDDDNDNDDDGNMKRPLILNDFYSKEMIMHTCCQIL